MNTPLLRALRTALLCLLTLGTSACQTPKAVQPESRAAAAGKAGAGNAPLKQRETERLTQCQTQLGALQNINPKQYQQYKQTFDHLMNSASHYARLRARVNDTTQEMVDALYHYKINYLCAGISQAVLIGLAEQGEQMKEESVK